MEHESKVSVKKEFRVSDIFSRVSRIIEVFQIIFNEPEIEKESMLLDFCRKFENCISVSDDFRVFDILRNYALAYAYKMDGPTESAVSRSLYFYLKEINLSVEDRNAIINSKDSSFVKNLRDFTNFSSAEGEDILTDAFIKCFDGEHFGLSQFLVKFGLVEFPSEANEKSRKIIRKLVKFLNSTYSSSRAENLPEEERIYVQFDDLFNQMTQDKNANFRRLIFILCSICIIAEYRTFDELGMRYNEDRFIKIFKRLSYRKLGCLDLFIEMTTEYTITIKDVGKFLSTILNRQLNEAVRVSLLEATRKMFGEVHDYYNPRSLKHIIRSKIRDCLRNSAVLPEVVHQLPIPVSLKDFIAFEEKEIWETLRNDQQIHYLKYGLIKDM